MLFAPVRLGSTALSADVLTADVKNCQHFGPCGVGEKALYLNSFLLDRRRYVALGDVRRVFKRVAMSKGGFTGNGVFGAIPYLVVEYGDGTQKQCTFKREDHVDDLLTYLAKVCPGLPLHSVQAEQRLAQRAREEAARYLDELTGGRGVVFATGTPISNSMVEMYTMQKYLQYGALRRNDLLHFDAWASTFGETVTAIELSPEGYTLIGR